jgi:aryl-alcohol dehydrogenase-like predicted oxidoreductase
MLPSGHVAGVAKPITRLVQGTQMLSSATREESFRLLDAVFEQGCTTFDTAHTYGEPKGDCERVLGQWVRERGLREQIVIIGKGAHHSRDRARVTPFDITADLFDSLARFGFDYDDPGVPVGPIVEVLNEHLRAGRIRAFGGSNWHHTRIAEANAYAAAHGLVPMVASSPNFSLARQIQPPWEGCISISGPQHAEARAWYAQTRLPLFCWSSLAGGFLSGRIRRDNLASFDTYYDRIAISTYAAEDNFERLDRAQQLAAERGVGVAQVALAYVLNHPLETFALVGCRNADEFAANVAATRLQLAPHECAWLDLHPDSQNAL